MILKRKGNMKRHFVILFISVATLTGCGSHREPTTPPADLATPAPSPTPPASDLTPPSNKVCYEQNCVNVIPASTIRDPNQDYDYPDYRNFPTADIREQYRAPHAYIDLQAQSTRIKVAKDFLLNEFVQLEKGRYGIILPVAVKMAQSIRNGLGGPLLITSGYRSPGYNAQVDGSAGWSRHTYGDAMDMQFGDLKKLEQQCAKNNASFILVYTAHVHCDWRRADLDPGFYPPISHGPVLHKLTEQVSRKLQISSTSAGSLHVEFPEEMDLEGVPLYRWTITDPAGQTSSFDTPQVKLPNPAPGTYRVDVVVGETLHTAKSIVW